MAAGIVYHNITTSPGVTFALACWVPNTSLPDVGAIPVSLPLKSDGTLADPTTFAKEAGGNLAAAAASLAHLDGTGVAITNLNASGSNADAASTSVALGVTDRALFGSLTDATTTGDTGAGSLAARLIRACINLTAINTNITGLIAAKLKSIGSVAHAGADADAPVKGGHKATTSLAGRTLVTDTQITDSFAGVDGVQIVRPHCNLEDIVTGVVICTAGANTSGIAALGAGLKFYLLAVLVSNTGGAAAGNLSITDGSGGTEKANVPFSTIGAVENLPAPIPFTANTAVFVDPSGSDTVKVTLIGFKSKV